MTNRDGSIEQVYVPERICVPHGEWKPISQMQEVRRMYCDCGHELGMTEIEKLCATLDTLGVSYEIGVEDATGFPCVKFDFNKYGHAYFNMEFGAPWISVSGDVKSLSDVATALLGRDV